MGYRDITGILAMHITSNGNLYQPTSRANPATPLSNANAPNAKEASTKTPNQPSDRVSISQQANHLFQADESKFTLNTVGHTYSENPENIADLGVMTVADPDHDINPNGVRQTTRFEAAVMGDYMESYREISRNPEQAMQANEADYALFLQQAEQLVAELKQSDTTDSFDISIGGLGDVRIENRHSRYASEGVLKQSTSDRESMTQWLEMNAGAMQDMAGKAKDYSYAKSMFDYQSATGITRDHLIDTQLKPIEGRDNAFKASDAELNEYMLKMQRYAENTFGTHPSSYAAVDQWGTPGYPRGGNGPPTLLPNMS